MRQTWIIARARRAGQCAMGLAQIGSSAFLEALDAGDMTGAARYASHRNIKPFDFDAHMESIGMNEMLSVEHNANMSLPENEIAAL